MNPKDQQYYDEVQNYFEEMCGITLNGFSFRDFCIETGLLANQALTLLCNMEHEEVQELIANGQYDQFDMWDSSQFNDSYYDVMEQLGLGDEDEEGEN